MAYFLGSAITLVIVLLVFAGTNRLSPAALRPLRRHAYVLSVAIPTLATAPDMLALAAIAIPAVALYEAAVALMG